MTAACDVLDARVKIAWPALAEAAGRLWGHERLREGYPLYLAEMHSVVRAATVLMEKARARCKSLARSDRTSVEPLAEYLQAHIPEERGHDEWILQDLAATGAAVADIKEQWGSASVASLVGAQMYWIEFAHPCALLGHMLVMEGHPPSRRFISELMCSTGYDKDCFRSLRRHAVLDVAHRRELRQVIDGLDLEKRLVQLMSLSALHTVASVAAMYHDVVSRLDGSVARGGSFEAQSSAL